MLAGLEEPDAGRIRMATGTTIGYLPQDGIVHQGKTVHEEVVVAFAPSLSSRKSSIASRTSSPTKATRPIMNACSPATPR